MKFLFIPLAFLLLRIGSIAVVIVFVYIQIHPQKWVTYLLLYVAVSENGNSREWTLYCKFPNFSVPLF